MHRRLAQAVLVAVTLSLTAVATPPESPPPGHAHAERGFRLLLSYTADDFESGAQNFSVTQDHRGVIYVGNLRIGTRIQPTISWSPQIARSIARSPRGEIVWP